MSGPLVSVALPTYNGERFLAEQLDSIYEQDWPNLEVVVSDDASSDGTAEILQRYAKRSGLRFSVNRRQLGLVRNFERAISSCRGELIALSDQDDLWKPNKLRRLVSSLEDYGLVYCSPQECLTEAGRIVVEPAFQPVVDFARRRGTGRVTRLLLAENWVVSHTVLFRREVAEKALPIPDHQTFHDAWLALVASTLGDGIRFLDERLQTYRRHPSSFTYVGSRPEAAGRTNVPRWKRFGATWRTKCKAEIARIGDALALPSLTSSDRAFGEMLVRFYESGLSKRLDWRAALIGARIGPCFATSHRPHQRSKLAVKGLIGGVLAGSSGRESATEGLAESPDDGN